MNRCKLQIFSDFDGTITAKDVWMDIGDYFIKDKELWSELIKKFENLEIGARECFSEEVALIQNFDMEKFHEIIDRQKIDDSFLYFYSYCRDENIPLTILSEGMDYYIERILRRNNIELPFYANHCEIMDSSPYPPSKGERESLRDSQINVTFPYSDSECTLCGCCKRNFILNMTGDDEISVLIGDGFSDICAAKYADVVFAKKSLASYCWKNNITYFEFQNFFDVQKKLEKLLEQNKLKQKQQARVNRKDVYLCG